MRIKLDELRELTNRAVLHYGYSEQEAEMISEVLLYAQLRGNNQGVVKLIGSGIPKSPDTQAVETIKESPVSALLNAHGTHAMIALNQAIDLGMKKAREQGIGLIGVNHIATSSGALGFYAKRIADSGLIGIIFAGSMETVAAEGSSEAIFGTNPLAIGIPGESEPVILDMTTAAMAFYGVVEANTAGRKLPEGIAYDKAGTPTTDPAAVLDDGALRSFDQSHKGSGLAMMVQMLTGPLVGSYFTGFGDVANNWGGHLVLAINPSLFGDLSSFRNGVAQMVGKVKATRKLPGVQEILVPGERGNSKTKEVLTSGEIEIEDNLYQELKKVAGSS